MSSTEIAAAAQSFRLLTPPPAPPPPPPPTPVAGCDARKLARRVKPSGESKGLSSKTDRRPTSDGNRTKEEEEEEEDKEKVKENKKDKQKTQLD